MERVGRWLQIGANIGILAGLILVGLQMSQNSELLKTQLMFSHSERQSDFGMAMLGEDPAAVWAKSQIQPAELDLREQQIMENYMLFTIEDWRSLYDLYILGLLSDEEWKTRVRRRATYVVNNPYGLATWNRYKDILPSELIEVVESDIETDGFQTLDHHAEIMEDAARLHSAASGKD